MNINECIGVKFNKLLVLKKMPKYKVLCMCDCGNEKSISWFSVKNSISKTCGCEQRSVRIKHKIGDRFGRLIITERLPNSKVIAKCDCGNIKEFYLTSLITMHTRSCGCFNMENITSHGLCDHPLYSVWEGIIQRCCNQNHKKYSNYGGKGVEVCEEWRNDFKIFHDWCINNGWKQELDIDKDLKSLEKPGKRYSPEFCSIISHRENLRIKSNNRFITYNGETLCLTEWAERIGINDSALRARLNRGWDIERAFKNENFKFNQLKKAS